MLNLLTRARACAGSAGALSIDGAESLRIQALRGLACLLLVAFHAIGSKMTSGLQVQNDSLYREFANSFVHIRMPLFTFLSGFVYAYRPLMRGHEQAFVLKKLRRLALPLAVATTVTYAMHVLLNDRSKRPPLDDLWEIYVFPYEHFWFVQALLLIFAVIVILESCGALRTLPRFLFVLALALPLHLHPPFDETSLFSIREATYLLPHFLLGLGANRFCTQLQSRAVFVVALACLVPAQAWHTFTVISTTPPPINTDMNRTALGLVIGMSATLCALHLVPYMKWAAAIGKCSYPIYLYHPIFVAGFRIIVGQIPGIPRMAMFAGCLLAGIAGPLLMSLMSARIPIVPLLLEGKGRGRTVAVTTRGLGEQGSQAAGKLGS